jgi:hypothetical protein
MMTEKMMSATQIFSIVRLRLSDKTGERVYALKHEAPLTLLPFN